MGSIKKSFTAKPSEPTPNTKLWLPECDQIQAYTHAPLLFVYHPDNNNNSVSSPFETWKNSLCRVLVPFYPLAGRLNWIDGGRFELHCNAMGAEIVEAESDGQLKDFADFRPTPETRKLLPHLDYTGDITELPLLVAELTRFKCGGITVGIAISHIAFDGKGVFGFIGSWTRLARGMKTISEPIHDRTAFYKGNSLSKPRFDHIELKASPMLMGKHDTSDEQRKESRTTLLRLSKEQVDRLKREANRDRDRARAKDDGDREYTRYEAIAGHIWRCASKARKLQNKQLTSLWIVVDCRNRLRPTLPPGYYGNAVMPTVAVTEIGQLLSNPLGLGYACGLISKSVHKFNDVYIRSAMDFLISQPDLTPLRAGFHSTKVTRGLFLGNPNLVVVSWLGMPLYDADFGWGEPIFMGPADIGSEGRTFILPGKYESGSIIVFIRLQVAHMDAFEKFFYMELPGGRL